MSVESKLKELQLRRHIVENLIQAIHAYSGAPACPPAKVRPAA
jgi:hypothetical protein